METRCIRCSTIVQSHKKLSELKCRCGGQLQRMKFIRLIEGTHPLGKEHNLELNGKLCYGTYRSVFGNFVIDRVNNTFRRVNLLR
ncbi:hypothetical protein ACFOTA_01725 [Chitinophaga sp. GCM10012297]|uniref:Uncharacterized protein n=1 Tax=Chitinophaga chungangae TaxID=2821488 RepID=A0ABS3Y8B7_9BACT|nr:hypothetical protein [Chitinophaga chungangae]MBO9150913.1 hypothetical protein [Chitinophaga chungangae]